MHLLKDQIALITGASRGIGQAIAMTFAEQGATVLGTATTEEGAKKISSAFKEANLNGSGFVLDVTEQSSIDSLFDSLSQQAILPSILINNAGITSDNLMLRMSDQAWESVINTNLSSVFRLTKWCLKSMLKARFGRIITLGSVVGSLGNAGQANYAAAKAGVIAFSRSLAREVATRGITVNVVSPGFIETKMTDALSDEQKNILLSNIPCKRMGFAIEIAYACLYLASPWASYVTGHTLHVNGGMYMN